MQLQLAFVMCIYVHACIVCAYIHVGAYAYIYVCVYMCNEKANGFVYSDVHSDH